MEQSANTPSWATTEGVATQSSSGSTKNSTPAGVVPPLAKSLIVRGFKSPTPIQRASIPSSVSNPPRDLLGMARTGSGKTLAYMIPLLQRLGSRHSKTFGPRALIICPNRELAIQILKVGKDLARGFRREDPGKEEALKWAVIMGGEGLDEQFAAITDNPDIIIATPGRFLHLSVEMSLDLRSIDVVVYDEADRLFEMGFDSQLREILHRLPTSRQNLLFSATLPSTVADFAKAGLVNPLLIRLDSEQKISADLSMRFFWVKPMEKDAALLVILKDLLEIPTAHSTIESRTQAIVFVSTKHHVEYVFNMLDTAGYAVSHIYGSLDQVARQRQMQAFRDGQSHILVVTDVAARGLDIPIMENVINYDFPTGSRVFVHRVGRTARAGNKGSAWSLVSYQELPYLYDLERFLGQSLTEGPTNAFGHIPRERLDAEVEHVFTILEEANSNLRSLREVMRKGQMMFERSRGKASSESYKRAKNFGRDTGSSSANTSLHPIFLSVDAEDLSDQNGARRSLLQTVEKYEPGETVFELGSRGRTPGAILMRNRRTTIQKRKKDGAPAKIEDSAHSSTFERIPPEVAKSFRDSSFYLSHEQTGAESERGYSLRDGASFSEQVRTATLNLNQDEGAAQRAQRASQLSWDRKKRKFVKGEGVGADNQKMIRGESGALLPATFQSGRFELWKKSKKVQMPKLGDQENSTHHSAVRNSTRRRSLKAHETELRTAAQVHEKRKVYEQRKAKNARPTRKT